MKHILNVFEKLAVYIQNSDKIKTRITPIQGCIKIIDAISSFVSLKNKRICVLSDSMILIYVVDILVNTGILKKENLYFVCHTKDVHKLAKSLEIHDTHIFLVEYSKLKNWLENWQVMQFDIIIGNVPFIKNVWHYFIKFNLLKPGGILALILPTNWVYSYHPAFKLLFEYEPLLLWLEISSWFPKINESIGFVIFKNIKRTSKCVKIYDSNLNGYDWVPGEFMFIRGLNECTHDMLTAVNRLDKRIPIKSNTSVPKIKRTNEYKYEVLCNWDIKYSNQPPPDEGKPRVFLSRGLRRNGKNRTMVSHIDPDGKYSHLDGFYFLTDPKDKKEPTSLSWLISESKFMMVFSGHCDKSPFLVPELRNNIPHIPSSIDSDDKLFKFLKLKQQTIDYIEYRCGQKKEKKN